MRVIAVVIMSGAMILLAGEAGLGAEHKPESAADYVLAYEQDFEGPSPLDDFVFTDSDAWRLAEEGGNHSLELKGGSDYSPSVRSPRNIALLADKQFGSFVLEARVKYTGRNYGHADQCLFFGFQEPDQYYYTHIGKKQDPHAHQIFIVDQKPRTAITDKSTTNGFRWKKNQWQRLRLVRDAKAGTIKVYAGDTEKPALIAKDTHFKRGWLGYGSFDDAGHIDDIRIWAPKGDVRDRSVDAFKSN
jgi:hypothetical protein